jgi:Uma2 family endonuclease
MKPPGGYPHGEIGGLIQWLLVDFVRRGQLGKVFDSSQGFELPSGDTVEPDHSFVSRERWAAAPTPVDGSFLRVVPDLVVEVLSPRTASNDRGEKKAIYQLNGVREYWLVDPRARSLSVFLLEGDRFDLGQSFAETASFESSVLAGLLVHVSELLPTD